MLMEAVCVEILLYGVKISIFSFLVKINVNFS